MLLGLCITHYFFCIKANCKCSEFFKCPVGVRQGFVLSPTLFSLFISQLADHVKEKGRHGIQLVPGVGELFILLFADDVALLSTTPTGLQNQLDCLKTCCQEIKMEVNKDKTKTWCLERVEFWLSIKKWLDDDTRLEVVNKHYLLYVNCFGKTINMYHVSAQGVDECIINLHYYYYYICF